MISGSAALTGTTSTRSALSYINDLITGATAEGKYQIFVGQEHIDESMINILRTTYGYRVTSKNNLMGTYNDYLISWLPAPTPTPTPTPA